MDWIDEFKSVAKYDDNAINVYIYGHSLDVTDKDILKRLILEKEANVTIFYHNKEAFGKQIANLVKVIGEDELIRRTDGKNSIITFKPTSSTKVNENNFAMAHS